MARSNRDLYHILNTMMHVMHSMFPARAIGSNDPISEKKMSKKDGQWKVKGGK